MNLRILLLGFSTLFLSISIASGEIQRSSSSSSGILIIKFETLSKSPTSFEIQAHKVIYNPHPIYETCYKYVVHLKIPSSNDPKKMDWHLVNPVHQIPGSGKFILGNLEPGTKYFIRAACQDQSNSVGPFSDPPYYSDTTPVSESGTGSGNSNSGSKNSGNDGKNSGESNSGDESDKNSSESGENSGNPKLLSLGCAYTLILISLFAIN